MSSTSRTTIGFVDSLKCLSVEATQVLEMEGLKGDDLKRNDTTRVRSSSRRKRAENVRTRIVQWQIPAYATDFSRSCRRGRARARRVRTISRGHGRPSLSRPADLPVDLSPGRHRLRRDDRPRTRVARRAAQAPVDRHADCRQTGAVLRRHDEVPPRAGRRQPHRVGLHPRYAVADLLPLHPGRLCDEVRVLPHRAHGNHP